MSWWVYVARCADETLYTGVSRDIERRMAEHNSGKGAKYTRSRRPVRAVYREEHPDKAAALRRELEIKRMARSGKLALISWAGGGS